MFQVYFAKTSNRDSSQISFTNTILIGWLIGLPGGEIYSQHCVDYRASFSHGSLLVEIN